MAYVLGYWYADGSVEHNPSMRGNYIRVGSTDKSIIYSFRDALDSEHSISTRKDLPNSKTYYVLRIGSKKLYSQLTSLGITERKSKTITFPNVPRKFLPDFLRGYFDGDGCVYIEKGRKNKYKRVSVIFTSGSRLFLETLSNELHAIYKLSNKKITITKGGYSDAYQLRYSTRDSLGLFQCMYPTSIKNNLFLERKKKVFETYLQAKGIKGHQIDELRHTKGPIMRTRK
ncbi:LAGLIDADG family homing endonuclease [Candidatus Kaiserbacteria bacterium]|nr:LAGLIDADG family homing endonuclease [Candidatus Kaiserbacteria bacterium]